MRVKIARDGISNVRVVDGTSLALPYPDDTFDIVMSGHVVVFERIIDYSSKNWYNMINT